MLGLAAWGVVYVGPAEAMETETSSVDIGAGMNSNEALRFTGPTGVQLRSQINFGPGFTVDRSVGYAFGNGLRGEFELGYRDTPEMNITLPSGLVGTPTNFKADAHLYTYLVNGIYDFHLTDLGPAFAQWTAHVGFGVGANVNGNRGPSDSTFAFRAIAGVEYKYMPRLHFGLDYGYLHRSDVNPTFTQVGITVGHATSTNIRDHAVLITAHWDFFSP
jgi:opacity protein-like surface antigen